MLKLTNPATQTKNFLGDDPGGTKVTKGHQTVNSDSDSGLDTHSLGSNGGGARETKDNGTRGTSQSESEDNRPEEPLKIETDVPKATSNQLTRNPTIVLPEKCRAKRRKMPFMGLAIRRNPDLRTVFRFYTTRWRSISSFHQKFDFEASNWMIRIFHLKITVGIKAHLDNINWNK